jgi:putative membrane-bound dehydrogenase-like protein
MMARRWIVPALIVAGLSAGPVAGRAPDGPQDPRPLRVLFLGHDRTHHPSVRLMPMLARTLARKGIQLTHVMTPAEALDPATLRHYDALMIYANHEAMTPAEEQALVEFVEGGKGLVAIHSASAMFTGSARYTALVGGQFARHGAGEFAAEIVRPDHPIVRGLEPFKTWDETYVHARHNAEGRTVLMDRVDADGREPYTWVRTQDRGRVFYTAFGHDERTWGNPGFQTLIERATVWAVDEQARAAWQALKMPDIKYVDGFNVPNYEKRDPPPKYQMPFTPADSMKFIQFPAEFRLELFASEPMISKPIAFSFDQHGRLWLIEAADYPNRVLNGQPGDDRIKILEDTDGDGRADKVTVFADRINLASSLTFANDGVIVAAAPHMLFLKDTDGDDRADERTVISTGWGTRDSHAGPSNLQYAPDNHVWGVVGYSGYEGEMNGRRMEFSQGVYRFRPDGSGFEFLTGSTNNTWGLGFSETFDVFGSTANNEPSFGMAIPNRYFEGVPGLTAGARRAGGPGYLSLAQFYNAHHLTPYIRQVDVFGGYTSAAGHHLYTARAFPRRYWNRIAFITEPTAHIVGQGIVEKDGAGFVTKDGWNLLAGAEEWVSPVQAQAGPDGAVWVADWYNFINQHNPTPPGFSNGPGNAYETSMRDRKRGRIYRVVYRNAPPQRAWSLSKDRPADLIGALASDNMLWRLHAQRLLVERGRTDVVPQLVALVRDRSIDAVGLNGAALHALWALHGLGVLHETTTEAGRAAVEALGHPAGGVRKAAAMVLPRDAAAAAALLEAGVVRDPDLHTRLAVFLALAEMPASAEIGRALYASGRDAVNYGDRWLGRALFIAAHRHRERFLTEYRADPDALSVAALPITLRLGDRLPDWREPPAADVAGHWKDMEMPGSWESKGLPAFDGVVWFTRTIDLPSSVASARSLTFGRVGNVLEVWINGTAIAAPSATPTSRPSYSLAAGVLRNGVNTITVRVRNFRGDGGLLGPAGEMALRLDEAAVPLAGTWKYRVERQTNAPALYSRPGELAAHLELATRMTAEPGSGGAAVAASGADAVLRLGVVPDQMKFDRIELAATAGQLVDLVFTNADVMPHNVLLGMPGSLDTIGAAADALLADGARAAAQQYVPEIPQVLVFTSLVQPGQSVTVQFRAPSEPGDYPFVCTFPGHWRVMNGVLHVRAAGAAP